jgi:FlaA1/EpsC-like NDP-sugar epimerase
MNLSKLRNRHFFVLDLLLLAVAVYVAYVLRLERFDLGMFWPGAFIFAGALILITPIVFRASGVYSRYWHYASTDELVLLASAIGAATVAAYITSQILIALAQVNYVIPRSAPFITFLLALAATAGPRLVVRVISRRLTRRAAPHAAAPGLRQRVAIMGAGDAGTMTARELQNNPQLGLDVAGYFDDDPAKRNVLIHGIPVLGSRDAIPTVVRTFDIRTIIIAMPTAPGRDIREIVDICEAAGVATKIIPGIYELLDGTVSVNQLRDVDIEDLLRRDPIHTDIAAVHDLVRGRRVLVTGGGGSIGSELCRQLFRQKPAELILLGHGENSIFEIYQEFQLRGEKEGVTVTAVVADIRFPERVEALFRALRPQLVFHAAAHKHVPLMEANPAEAVTNNVFGTLHLLRAAKASGVERFVMISTDKAVNPTSVMGATKRVAELLVHETARAIGKPYVTVRFGNVLGSRGSVVFTFKKQIAAGGPVTVTHPDIERFFMTIPEAVQLVLQAAVLGHGGEVFILDMGDPVKIVDLARDLIELSGLQVGRDVEIAYTGLRPGEKLYEELFVKGETNRRTAHEKIFTAANAGSFVPPDLHKLVEQLGDAAARNDRAAITRCLQTIVPAYRPANGVPGAETSPAIETADQPVTGRQWAANRAS